MWVRVRADITEPQWPWATRSFWHNMRRCGTGWGLPVPKLGGIFFKVKMMTVTISVRCFFFRRNIGVLPTRAEWPGPGCKEARHALGSDQLPGSLLLFQIVGRGLRGPGYPSRNTKAHVPASPSCDAMHCCSGLSGAC